MKKLMLSAAIVFLAVSTARADFTIAQAENAVDAFNSLNGGQGYYYHVLPDKGRYEMKTVQGYDQADLGAYNPLAGGEFFAKTFCVEPLVGTASKQYGKLNYENGATTTSSGHALTLGAAYLYTSFATGNLAGYNYESPNYYEGDDLTKAIQYLMGSIFDTGWTYWESNDFLSALLGIDDDKSFWEQTYDPGRYYDILGDYSVFVMNNTGEDGSDRQDFLYLAAHDGNSSGAVTPEPASLLIFGTGLLGLGIAHRLRKKRVK